MPKPKSPRKRNPAKIKPPKAKPVPAPVPAPGPGAGTAVPVNEPHFGEAAPTPDPKQFRDPKSDTQYYNLVNKTQLQPVPRPRDVTLFPDRLQLTLEKAWGSKGAKKVQQIRDAKRIVFHAVGDTGPVAKSGPANVVMVANKMNADFNEANAAEVPSFFYHLGDVVYSFGEEEYYYDQFYEPFRDYAAPIFAIPGNHDGVVYTSDPAASLAAFLENLCSDTWRISPGTGSLLRTTMIQPGVYFTLVAPLVTIIGVYSNVLEDPGVISSEGNANSPVTDDQLVYLKSELTQLKAANNKGALIVAVHHPPFTGGSTHGGSQRMLQDLDNPFAAAKFWPHAVLSGHAHNYQRFTRIEGNRETPYVIAGSGGHAANKIRTGKGAPPLRVPMTMGNVRFENYSENFGYLRVVVTDALLNIEFHDATTGTNSKSPNDVVTVDLASHKLTTARPPALT